ncbi:MAG: hypothetical protein JRJ39_01645 [Deltaproteobacteria bacterium]|nr:hypothetical protein [Deltaproteobacteria bacterium]MBW1847678.1 hypothetical protein [Deltaproteobacteria bacterium]MBW2365006.1 hypothetical protein [Deltaproteobacteria bacterium]
MIQENELILLILGIGVLAFFTMGRVRIKELPRWRMFLLAFTVLVVGWIFTILEGFFWPEVFNLIEHSCYAVNSILLAVWCWWIFTDRKWMVK